MATLDELQAQLAALTQRVNEITAPPDDYYTHRFSGEEIDNAVDRVKATPGSGAITAGDIGAATAPLLSDVILYVNGTSGSDSNPGTQSEPFKTIQAAVDSLPKNLGEHSATIKILPGVYDEDILFYGFYNGYSPVNNNFDGIFITSDSDPVEIRSLSFINCLVASILAANIKIIGGVSTSKIGVRVVGCPHVVLSVCEINGCTKGLSCGTYFTGGGSSVYLNVCTISNCTESAIYAEGQNNIYAETPAGNDNAVGITAYYGAVVTTRGSLMTATTEQRIYAGFINKF